MLRLEIDTKDLVAELDNKIAGIKEMQASSVLNEVSKAVFAITGERFALAVDRYARQNPKKMHHVYEWGGVGEANKRLFVLERANMLGGMLAINATFLPSRLPVPINSEMLTASNNGKVVSRRSIFRNKASVMESGAPVSFQAKRVLAFMGSDGIAFVAPGTQINILHPGGVATNNAFGSYMLDWYTKNGNIVMESSGFYERLTNEVALTLNQKGAGITQVRAAVARAANAVAGGKTVIK
jgi:hypothetical protein